MIGRTEEQKMLQSLLEEEDSQCLTFFVIYSLIFQVPNKKANKTADKSLQKQ
ncbi:MAG: hypothetical protein IJ708_06040 [Clostridia bacterium]|nr:hypothetical protein [Clostridia bacterium]